MGLFRKNGLRRLKNAPKNARHNATKRHKAAVALDQKRLELTELKVLKAANDVAELFDGITPRELAKIAP